MAWLQSVQTTVPETVVTQRAVRDIFAAQPGMDRLAQRIIASAFDASGIERRHTVIDEFDPAHVGDAPVFFDRSRQVLRAPSTRVRNDVYTLTAGSLFVDAARRAVGAAGGIDAGDITHVVTVSCTGFYAPGPDHEIARDLGLRADVQRYHLGFMGCYAALPALRAAAQFCAADPDAVVLVVCAEVCTVHLSPSSDTERIVAASLFADGAAAGIVSNRAPAPGRAALRLDTFQTMVAPDSERAMAWTIGDEGFEMALSSYVPRVIGAHIDDAVHRLLAHDRDVADADDGSLADIVAHWVIHPGGREILDRVQQRLGLSDAQLAPSRDTLREYGNMSSATVLFVLKHLFDGSDLRHGDRVATMAFGPGLTVESGLFTVEQGTP